MSEGSTGTAGILPASSLASAPNADKMSAVPVKPFSLTKNLQNQLVAEARAAYPRECCGLIEGVRTGEAFEVLRLHPTRNLADGPDRFAIDPAEHFRLLRALRGGPTAIIGCYHSHPNGIAEPSPRDCESAAEEGFVWLIVAVTGDGRAETAAHVARNGGFRPLA
jgi:proteasome lid subunit RPN8/RPN11